MKNKQFSTYSTFTKSVNEEKGYIDIEGWASKAFTDGKPNVDRDNEHVLTSTFDVSHAKVLLAQHDWDRVIGSLELSHRPEGIWLKGKVYKELDAKTYFAVKEGILDSFSIGFTAKDYDFIKVDDEEVIQLKSGEIHEVSVVSIPALREATISSVKSMVNKDGIVTGIQCSVDALKEMNPECGCDFEVEIKRDKQLKDINEIVKGLTFEETERESWNQKQKLNHYMGILLETVDDNWYESMWSEDMSGEDVKKNILKAIESFKSKLDELSFLSDDIETEQKGIKEMKVKSEGVEEASTEGQKPETETPTEEVETEVVSGEENTESEESTTSSESEDNQEEVGDEGEAEEVEETEAEEPKEDSKPKYDVQGTVGYIETLDIDSLDPTEVEALWDSMSRFQGKVEGAVEEALQESEEEA